MPEANSIPVPSDPVGWYLGHDPSATSKPKLFRINLITVKVKGIYAGKLIEE